MRTWTSSNNSVATVSPNGLVIGQSAGVATITAQDGAITAAASVLAESAALTSIQVSPHARTVPAGVWTEFGATGTFSNGDTQDLTTFVNWTSSNSSAATISNAISTAGQATGVQPGTSTISAVFSGQVGTATLTVSNETLTSTSLTPSSASIAVGSSQAFHRDRHLQRRYSPRHHQPGSLEFIDSFSGNGQFQRNRRRRKFRNRHHLRNC